MKQYILMFLLSIMQIVYGLEQSTIVNFTITDAKKGLLNGIYPATLRLYNQKTNETYWRADEQLVFTNGFTETVIGPLTTEGTIETPYLEVTIDTNRLVFPMFPTLLAVHSEYAHQLSHPNALYIHGNKVGLGTQTPAEKLSIDGNIKFLNESNGIHFSNTAIFNAQLMNTIISSINSIETSMNSIETSISYLTNQSEPDEGTDSSHTDSIDAQASLISSHTDSIDAQALLISSHTASIDAQALLISSHTASIDAQASLISSHTASIDALQLLTAGIDSIDSLGGNNFSNAFAIKANTIDINQSNISNNTLITWKDDQFHSLSIGNDLVITNNQLDLHPVIHPSAENELSIHGSLRLVSSNSTILNSNGSIQYNGTDIVGYVNGAWQSLTNIPSKSATPGDQLVWNGTDWVASSNAIFDAIHLDGNTFSIGTYLHSSPSTPLRIRSSDDDKDVITITDEGQLLIGYSEGYNYTFASTGFNYLTHLIAPFNSAIGTTNIGTNDQGPALLIQTINSDTSTLKVLNQSGDTLFDIQDNHRIGVNTDSPQATLDINGTLKLSTNNIQQATLDINGTLKLSTNNTQPIACNASQGGTIALTSLYSLCICNENKWVQSNDSLSDCNWSGN